MFNSSQARAFVRRVDYMRHAYTAQQDLHGRMSLQKAVWEAAIICIRPCKLTFDLLTLKVVSKSHVTWAPLCQF